MAEERKKWKARFFEDYGLEARFWLCISEDHIVLLKEVAQRFAAVCRKQPVEPLVAG